MPVAVQLCRGVPCDGNIVALVQERLADVLDRVAPIRLEILDLTLSERLATGSYGRGEESTGWLIPNLMRTQSMAFLLNLFL